jgi:hypothetical protein
VRAPSTEPSSLEFQSLFSWIRPFGGDGLQPLAAVDVVSSEIDRIAPRRGCTCPREWAKEEEPPEGDESPVMAHIGPVKCEVCGGYYGIRLVHFIVTTREEADAAIRELTRLSGTPRQ